MAATECLAEKHYVVHREGDQYSCSNCTGRTNTTFYVTPLPEWADHTHTLVYWHWDGDDNCYKCLQCGVFSHDHKAFAAQEHRKQ